MERDGGPRFRTPEEIGHPTDTSGRRAAAAACAVPDGKRDRDERGGPGAADRARADDHAFGPRIGAADQRGAGRPADRDAGQARIGVFRVPRRAGRDSRGPARISGDRRGHDGENDIR